MKFKREQPEKDIAVTPDCESVRNYLNLLPQSEQNSQGLENVDTSIIVGANANESKISSETNEHSNKAIESEIKESNVQQGENISYQTQTNNVDKNSGITGIQGNGNTINIYQCPKELAELLIQLTKSSY
jgi:hypothetical protein